MKRRSKAGGAPIKGRRRKAPKPKRPNAPKTAPRIQSSPSRVVARLTHELRETTEQHTATSEILRVISSSPNDLQPVFQAMLKNAVRLCDAKFGNIYRWDGGALHLVATQNVPAAFVQVRGRSPLRPSPPTPTGRMIATKTVVNVADMRAERAYADRDPYIVAGVELGGVRSALVVPMLKDDELIGSFSVYRQQVQAFTDKQIALVQNFASQAVIAIENARLLNELRRRTTDLTEALEQQTATSEVLQVISGSAGDVEPVFATMLEKAVRICDASFGNIYRWDGRALHLVATHDTPPAFAEARSRLTLHPGSNSLIGRVLATKAVVHIADVAATQAYEQRVQETVAAVELGGVRTILGVPMHHEGELIGSFTLYRKEVRPFTDKQVALVTNFAAQAVIAIENARLLNELRQRTDDLSERTTDLTETLEQQTATSDVLKVISSSPGDLQPVFEAMLDKAVRICRANAASLFLYEGGILRRAARHSDVADATMPIAPSAKSGTMRSIATKRVIHIANYLADPAYLEGDEYVVAAAERLGLRASLHVPMFREQEVVGAFTIWRTEAGAFTVKQVELMKNFAAQAVIAIENARLLNELRRRTDDLSRRTSELTEALERQTATSDVLQVISSSPGDLEPVFTTILENAARICEANFGNVYLWDGDALHLVAAHNTPRAFADTRKRAPFRPNTGHPFRSLAETKQVFHVADIMTLPIYQEGDPQIVEAVELGKMRTCLGVPMLKDNNLIGAVLVFRQEVRLFTANQIALITNFAAQAVIAIENARLLNELRHLPTAQVLQVISSSTDHLAHVFATMLENATRICDAKFGTLYLKERDGFRAAATHNAPPSYEEARAKVVHPSPHATLWQAANTKRPVQIADVTLERGYLEGEPFVVSAFTMGRYRSVLSVPMLHEDQVMGVITIFRQEVSSFSAEHISLLQNFAAQAVIAIENARLLNDLRDRTQQLQAQSEELANLNQQLERRVADQVGEIERMGRLRRFLPPQVADLIVASGSEKQLESHRREITALFCDLRGFTGFTESADAEDVMALLRDYHAAIGELVIKYNGTLERYAGDGVMVIFNDPVPVENPALQAVLVALELRGALGALTTIWSRLGHEIGFGIGIAHGFATLGTIGYEGRFDYAAIGTVSNVASRLCDEAKPGQILISARVLTKVEDAVKVEPVGEFELKGIRRPLAAYNVLSAV